MKQRTPEERELYTSVMQVCGEITEWIFETLEKVTAHDSRIKYGNGHVDLEVAIAVDFTRRQVLIPFREGDNFEIARDIIKDQLQKLYNEMNGENRT